MLVVTDLPLNLLETLMDTLELLSRLKVTKIFFAELLKCYVWSETLRGTTDNTENVTSGVMKRLNMENYSLLPTC